MAIIMIHHIAIISAHVANAQGAGVIGAPPTSMPPVPIPGMSGIMSAASRCGNSESVVISHALMPSPAPVKM